MTQNATISVSGFCDPMYQLSRQNTAVRFVKSRKLVNIKKKVVKTQRVEFTQSISIKVEETTYGSKNI